MFSTPMDKPNIQLLLTNIDSLSDSTSNENDFYNQLNREVSAVCIELAGTEQPYDENINRLFQFFAKENPVEFKELCLKQPQTHIEKMLGDKELAQQYLEKFKSEWIDEILMAMFNSGRNLDNFIRDLNLMNWHESHPEEEDRKGKTFVQDDKYNAALFKMKHLVKKYPEVDVEMKKKQDYIDKKVNSLNKNVDSIKTELEKEIKELITIIRNKSPELKNISDETIEYNILGSHSLAFEKSIYDKSDPEIQNAILQLKAFKKIHDSLDQNPKSILIVTENAAKEILNAELYKQKDNAGQQRKPNRFLHILNTVIMVGLPFAIHLYSKHKNIFFANNVDRIANQKRQIVLSAGKSVKEKTDRIYKKLKR